MNLADLWSTANAWHVARENAAVEAELLAIRTAPVRLIACPVIHIYDDGWRWVHVAGEPALRAEGDAMNHCVGNGLYVQLTGSRAVLSLRDPEGMPHVTAAMCGDHLMMAKGRSNSTPTKYWQQVNDMVAHVGAYLQTHATMGWADSDLAATVKAAKAARVAAQAEASSARVLADDAEGLRYAAPVDIETWAVANGLLDDRGGDRTQPSYGDYAGQGTRGSIRPGMTADETLAGSTWVSGWRHTVDRIIYGSDAADCLAYAIAAERHDRGPFVNPNLSIAYDPSALPSDDCAPAADGGPTP